ncbi:chorismate mutase [Microbacteriaceae bacterium 4G12]
MIRAIRGAITVEVNEAEEILNATERLVREMASQNSIIPNSIVSILISATTDIYACFPAAALRRLEGWMHVPVMCMQEINVPGAIDKCIRVMMTVEAEMQQHEVAHIYLERAVQLRPDLRNK